MTNYDDRDDDRDDDGDDDGNEDGNIYLPFLGCAINCCMQILVFWTGVAVT